MSLLKQSRSGFFGHTYALLISSMVIGAVLYTLYGQSSIGEVESAEPSYKYATATNVIRPTEFNYGATPKPDSYSDEIRITVPHWLSLTPPASVEAVTASRASVEEAKFNPVNLRPRIAIIIDDMGMRQNMTRPFANLDVPIDFSFLPYAEGLAWQTKIMIEAGHELMLHLPMEPSLADQNPGPKALLTSLSDSGLNEVLNWNLSRFDGFVGINNHMGSLFTEDEELMAVVIERLKASGLFFIDSRTSSKSTGFKMAKTHGLKYEDRDVFLDNILEPEAIIAQFDELERIALETGSAIAIGHPHAETLKILQHWLDSAEARGFDVVKVSSLLLQEEPVLEVLSRQSEAVDLRISNGGGN